MASISEDTGEETPLQVCIFGPIFLLQLSLIIIVVNFDLAWLGTQTIKAC